MYCKKAFEFNQLKKSIVWAITYKGYNAGRLTAINGQLDNLTVTLEIWEGTTEDYEQTFNVNNYEKY